MIAVSIGPIDIYRYGIFYFVSIILGYIFFRNIAHTQRVQRIGLRDIFANHLDDLMLYIVLGVMIGGRLGDVLIYNRSHYIAHPIQILYIWQGGMSFIGGWIGVMIAIYIFTRQHKLTISQQMYIYDMIVLVLPIAIILGRLGNFLNQELIGKSIYAVWPDISQTIYAYLYHFKLIYIYNHIDRLPRINSNLLELIGEGVFTFIADMYYFLRSFIYHPKPGYITGIFMIVYAVMRFTLERLRDNPSEYIGWMPISALWMIGFVGVGGGLLYIFRRD